MSAGQEVETTGVKLRRRAVATQFRESESDTKVSGQNISDGLETSCLESLEFAE